MKITTIPRQAQEVSRWSGGTTTQLAMYPPHAQYADRNFLWRVSSAVVALPESDFTPLPDYDRILMILDGELTLSHDGGTEYRLCSLEQTAFDGASHTVSRGRVTDFNLMLRKNRCRGRVTAQTLHDEAWTLLPQKYRTQLLYCIEGSVELSGYSVEILLTKGEAILLEWDEEKTELVVHGTATLVLAEVAEI